MSVVDNIVNNSETQVPEQDAEKAKLLEKLYSLRLSAEEEIEEDQYLLEIDGTGFFAKGDLSAIKAKPKHGKTNAIAVMAAALLKGFWGPLVCRIKDSKILWIDTEQRRNDAIKIYLRTLKMAGLPNKDMYDIFQMFPLRSFMNDDKMESLKELIKDFQPDIVFIDGIVDLMLNFNDVEQSKKVIDDLMRLSTKEESGKEIAIVCVLHTNKATEDDNMRGHLGTMLTQKAGTVLKVTKKDNMFTISNTESRNKEVPEWSFCFDKNGDIVDTTEIVAQMTQEHKMKREAEKQEKKNAEVQKLIETMKDIIRKHGGKIKRVDFRDELIGITGKAVQTVDGYIRNYIAAGIIKQIQGYVYIADEADDSNQQNLPFF
ncbi:MAG: AAA family ATPase [Prevotella sp.]